MPFNLENDTKTREEFIAEAETHADAGDSKAFAGALYDKMTALAENIKAEMAGETARQDSGIVMARGGQPLTAAETKYWSKVIEAMKSSDANVKASLENVKEVMPETVIDRVFDELTKKYPLLAEINFINTGAIIKMIFGDSSGKAVWGDLTAAITAELKGEFSKDEKMLLKLSAFMLVAKAYLDLGPAWLDRFVRSILMDKLAEALEYGIVDGDGDKKPIGMTRRLTGATDSVYPRKTVVVVNNLSPETIGGILDTVSKGRKWSETNDIRRDVPSLLMVVNPSDYFTKVFPAVTPLTATGQYAQNVFPYPVKVVRSGSMPKGRAVFGIASKYMMALGTGAGGRLEYSDEYKFLEDQRTYLIKLYGYGQPEDENAFVFTDISGMKPSAMRIQIVGEELPEA